MGQYQRTSVGAAELIAVQDSWAALPATQFFPESTEADWEPYRELLDAEGNVTLNLGAWVIRSEGRLILVDTGIGGRPVRMPLRAEPALPSVLEQAGIRPADVDVVVFSHLHFDHTGWNTVDEAGTPRPLFANARHVIQRAEWEYWTGDEERRTAAGHANVLAPLEAAGLLDLVEGEHAVTGEVTTVLTPGHTPGHVSFVIASGGEHAYVLGDAAHHAVQVTLPDWCPGADIDKPLARASRHALLDRVAAEQALLASGHFPFPGLGRVVEEGGRRVFRAL